jgi:hypothetical protein
MSDTSAKKARVPPRWFVVTSWHVFMTRRRPDTGSEVHR